MQGPLSKKWSEKLAIHFQETALHERVSAKKIVTFASKRVARKSEPQNQVAFP